MMRKSIFFLLASGLLIPSPAWSQAQARSASGPAADSAEIEAIIFERALQEIATRHREGYSQAVLWTKTLDALFAPQTDSTILAFTPEEIAVFNGVRETDNPDDLEELFAEAIELTAESRPGAFTEFGLWSRALDGLIRSLNDPYAEVFTPEEVENFDETNTGNYSGIGIQITQLNQQVTVTAVFRGTPAEQSGLIVGDIIVGVNGEDTSDWTTADVSDVVRGPVGTQVSIRVRRVGSITTIPFVLTRDQVHVPAVESAILSDSIGYVRIDRVARGSAEEVDLALRDLRDTRGVILDVRRNPGGYLDEALMMADVFLQPGQRLASLRSRDPSRASGETTESWNARMEARIPDKPIVILVDEFSASAAEILAGALQDYDRALVVGERSFGKGIVQTVLPLPFNHRLRITTGTWHTPLGRALHRPRDADAVPLEESLDTFPRITTESGRELFATGGVFPDLEIQDDTLKFPERELLRLTGEAEVPLGVRIQEFAFDRAQVLKQSSQAPRLDEEPFAEFVAELIEEGVPREALDDPIARDYLAWWTSSAIAERMDDLSASLTFRMERDPQLAEAVRLLSASRSQVELFAAAERASEAQQAATSGVSPRGQG